MIYTEKKHELYSNFQNLFYFEGEGRQNKENVFVKIYGPNGASNAIVYHNQSSTKATQVSLTRQMIDKFLYADGLPRKQSSYYKMDLNHNDIFTNRDPRLAMTVFHIRKKLSKELNSVLSTLQTMVEPVILSRRDILTANSTPMVKRLLTK